ncbi:MAG: glycosyltransferase family 39 protein [bacterium]|nr:glycosyltransferase family 39 protein [bacterium]
MTAYQKSTVLFFAIAVLFELSVGLVGEIKNRPVWGDESHFYETSADFAEAITLEKLTHYHEMSTPLPFVVYGVWGRLFGSDLFTMRLLSILIALLTYLLFHRILYELTSSKLALLGALFLMVHPYMVGLSIFVFTDMMAILLMLVAVWAVLHNRIYLYAIAVCLAILCRQYAVFILPAVWFYYYGRAAGIEKRGIAGISVASLVSIVPFALLVILWGGLSPDNEWRQLYLSDGLTLTPNVLSLYVALLFIYLFPYYWFSFREFIASRMILVLSLFLSLGYFIYPVEPSQFSVAIGVHTVGLLHRGLQALFGSDTIVQSLFYLFTLMGLPVLLTIGKSAIADLCDRKGRARLLFDLLILAYFLVMPFSYLGWEKYFMLILPIVILRLSMMMGESEEARGCQKQDD